MSAGVSGQANGMKRWGISRNVFALGLVSFFNDVASEIVYPLLPIFLTGVLGAPATVVGLIEGIAETTASTLKVVSGWLSDRWRRRKPFVLAGYSLSAFSKAILGLAFSWPAVLAGRFADRFGKGVRTSARDALISESSDSESRGRAFGFHRALDTLGAVVGPLIAILAIHFLEEDFRLVFFLAAIPACIGVLLLLLLVREKREAEASPTLPRFRWRELDPHFKVFLLISVIFAIGNSSDAFLILRAKDLGLSTVMAVLAYVLFNLTYAVFSMPAGIASDRIGPRRVLLAGFLLFSAVYLLYGLAGSSLYLWFLFPFYGIYMAFTEGVGKAYISNLCSREKAGTVFGLYQTATGICTFFASLIAGFLWTYVAPSAPFIFGSVTALVSAALFVALRKRGAACEVPTGEA